MFLQVAFDGAESKLNGIVVRAIIRRQENNNNSSLTEYILDNFHMVDGAVVHHSH